MVSNEALKRLKTAGLLSEETTDLGNVPTGSYALNKVISGSYTKGIPVGAITQFHGEASTAKTVFVTHILKEAQKLGHWTILLDSENAYNPIFAESLGIDPGKLIYVAPETVEGCFETIEVLVKEIREQDKDTPIVIGYDSIAVSPSKAEYEAETYDGNNMVGAIRAKATGACLRKINPLIRREKVALVIVNQIRNKIGVMFGDNTTAAAGGKSLDYYLGVNLKTLSAKGDHIKDEFDNVVGIKGRIRNTKNKISLPFRSCDFKLLFDQGLDPYFGLLDSLVTNKVITKEGNWFQYGDSKKFQKKTFYEGIDTPEFGWLEKELKSG